MRNIVDEAVEMFCLQIDTFLRNKSPWDVSVIYPKYTTLKTDCGEISLRCSMRKHPNEARLVFCVDFVRIHILDPFQRKGVFTRVLKHVENKHFNVFVECVMPDDNGQTWFQAYFDRNGFTEVTHDKMQPVPIKDFIKISK